MPDETDGQSTSRKRHPRFLGPAVLTLVIVVPILGIYLFLARIDREISGAYALMRADYLLADYVCEHQSWPDGWDALLEIAEAEDPGRGQQEIAYLSKKVGVNWDLDLDAFLSTKQADDRSRFETTHLLSGSKACWEEPYDEIYYEIYKRCGRDLGMQLE